MEEKIIVTIEPDGSTLVEGDGFQGPACDKALREIAEKLGTVTEVTKKHEFYVRPNAQANRA